MKNTTNHWLLLLAVTTFTLVTAAVTFAQGGSVNLPAEGSISRSAGQFGVNRRVAIGQPEDATVVGYYRMSAIFNTALQVPTGSALNNLPPGRLPNKPSFYFGLKGSGRHWVPDDPSFTPPMNDGEWVTGSNLEIDAGLEYDSRPTYRGWRAFISVNRVQVNYSSGGVPWRGQASGYHLVFRVDENGIPYLTVVGGDANFTFTWHHTGVLRTTGDWVLPYSSRSTVGMKRVIANTRPRPASGLVEDNYRLDGTRFTCTTSASQITYWRNTAVGRTEETRYLSPRYPNDPDNPYAPLHFGIDGVNTGYDTPATGVNSYDWPRNPPNNMIPTRNSRRIVDFAGLDGATSTNIGGVVTPNIIDTGRARGSQWATQGGESRYRRETVRINLYTTRRAQGRLNFIRRGTP